MTKPLLEDANVVGGGAVAGREVPLGKKPQKRDPEADLEEKVKGIIEELAYEKLSPVLEGARWDSHSGSWVGGGTDEQHPGWNPHDPRTPSQQAKDWRRGKTQRSDGVKYYYAVPFAKRDEAKKLGMRFDPVKKSWWSHLDQDEIGPFKRDWTPHGR